MFLALHLLHAGLKMWLIKQAKPSENIHKNSSKYINHTIQDFGVTISREHFLSTIVKQWKNVLSFIECIAQNNHHQYHVVILSSSSMF